MYKEYFTLKSRSGKSKDTEYPTYEEAYDAMCKLYFKEQKASYDNPKGIPERYGIYKTTVNDYQGRINTMTQAVWG